MKENITYPYKTNEIDVFGDEVWIYAPEPLDKYADGGGLSGRNLEIVIGDKTVTYKPENALLAAQLTIIRDLQRNYVGTASADEMVAYATTEFDKRIKFTGDVTDAKKERVLKYLATDIVSKSLGEKGLMDKGGEINNPKKNKVMDTKLKYGGETMDNIENVYYIKSPNENEVFDTYEEALDFLKGLDKDEADMAEFFLLRGKSLEREVYKYDNEEFDPEILAKGGSIKNQYKGKTPEQVWNSWTKDQRMHFLIDHDAIINKAHEKAGNEFTTLNSERFYVDRFNELPDAIHRALSEHVLEGSYANGGTISADWGNDGSTPSNNKDYNELYAMFPDDYSGAKAIWSQLTPQQKEGFLYDLRVTDAASEHIEESWLEFINSSSYEDWLQNATNWDEMAKGGGVGAGATNELKTYFSSLNAAELPLKAADYLKTELLSDKDLLLLDASDEDFVEIVSIISSQYPGALKVSGSEPTKQDYIAALDSYNTMVEVSTGDEKAQYEGAIDSVKLMLELQFGEKYEYGGGVDCGCDHK